MHPHLARLHDALKAEEAHQGREHARLSSLPFADRIAAGVSWPVVHATELGIRRRLTVRSASDLHDGIRPGDLVHVGPVDASDGVRSRVLEVEDDTAVLEQEWSRHADGYDVVGAGPLEVRLAFDPSTFVRFRQALERADAADSPLKAALLAPGPQEPPPPVDLPHADPAQRAAAGVAVHASPLGLVHGPPGTGKTWLLARVLKRLVDDGDRPWALADSNAAVDNLALAADAVGLRVLRMGREERIGPAARRLSVRAAVRSGPFGQALAAMDKELGRDPSGPLFGERRRLRAQARAHAVASAQVVAVTFGTLARLGPDLPPARTAVVDEATQAIEPAVWSAVPHVARLVLVGDPEQLGPVVMDPGNPLERSLLVRLLDEGMEAAPLQRQHRMHRAVQACVEDVYGGGYHPADAVAEHLLADLPGVRGEAASDPVRWIDTAGAGFEEARDPVTRSMHNPGEIGVVAIAVRRLRDAGVDPSVVGVIAPYSAQVARLKRHPALQGVEVATVNAFQGREKEAIVVSFVRSNPDAELGFVADPRRLTVAVTRARRALILVGDSATLAGHPRFAALIERLEAAGRLSSVWEPPWSAALDLAPGGGRG